MEIPTIPVRVEARTATLTVTNLVSDDMVYITVGDRVIYLGRAMDATLEVQVPQDEVFVRVRNALEHLVPYETTTTQDTIAVVRVLEDY
jgi:hypothetical protein